MFFPLTGRPSSQCTSGKYGTGLVDLPNINPGMALRANATTSSDQQSKEVPLWSFNRQTVPDSAFRREAPALSRFLLRTITSTSIHPSMDSIFSVDADR